MNNLAQLILDLDEKDTYVSFILNGASAENTYDKLVGFGIDFFRETDLETFQDEIEELFATQDVITIARNNYKDGESEFFIEVTLTDKGETLGCEDTITFIDETVEEFVDLDKINSKQIVVICENEEETEDEEKELEYFIEDWATTLDDVKNDSDFDSVAFIMAVLEDFCDEFN